MDKSTKQKAVMIACLGLAWLIYLATNILNTGREYYNISTKIDSYIPFIPVFILFYLLWWPIVWLPVFLAFKDKKMLTKVSISFILLIIISNILFLAFPTKIIRPEVIGEGVINLLIRIFYMLDSPYNLIPSLHVSSLVLSYFITRKIRKSMAKRLLPLYLVILISPLLVKQHYLLDVIAGMLAGFLIYCIFFIWRRR